MGKLILWLFGGFGALFVAFLGFAMGLHAWRSNTDPNYAKELEADAKARAEQAKVNESKRKAEAAEAARPKLEMLIEPGSEIEYKFERTEYGGVALTGRVRNNTKRRYTYAQVTFAHMNGKGEQAGTVMANINGLEPGGIWRYKAVLLTPMAKGDYFMPKDVSGW